MSLSTAGGISAKVAQDHVFKFGRQDDEGHEADRLSVYGIGLKRAIFKLGNKINISSDHKDGGFALKLNVASWAKIRTQPWTFDIEERTPSAENTGTKIVVTDLYDDVKRRLSDGIFEGQLKEAISKTYAYYLTKFVRIYVNDAPDFGVEFEIGSNVEKQEFTFGEVFCSVTAGIGVPVGGKFRDRSSGWFVFCNGRAVISADKSELTGWGSVGFPIFQPKHRPFLGTAFFVSSDAEQLPWTTTKSAINEDSALWQEAKRQMASVGRKVITFLDGRYTDEGTEVASEDLREAAGARATVISAAVSKKSSFSPPKRAAPVTA